MLDITGKALDLQRRTIETLRQAFIEIDPKPEEMTRLLKQLDVLHQMQAKMLEITRTVLEAQHCIMKALHKTLDENTSQPDEMALVMKQIDDLYQAAIAEIECLASSD
ncbi:MAG: hypothetical protein WC551_11755 [Patescibacteria group bacterium]